MKYGIVYEEDPESGGWGGYSPDVPGCYAFGKTLRIVKRRMKTAIKFRLEGLAETGEEIPQPRHVVGSIFIA
jgi:predicted RNase H-like HicB family nuclease